MKTIVIRADSTVEIGTGHIMRCLALSQIWRDEGGEVTFVTAHLGPSMESLLLRERFQVHYISSEPGSVEDAQKTITFSNSVGAQWVVVDGYQFGADYLKILKKNDCRILFIDDYGHADHYYADIVLNQNLYASMDLYPHHPPYTQFLLGGKYFLLRKEFLDKKAGQKIIKTDVQSILVTMGGSDPDNITNVVINELGHIIEGLDISVTVVIGKMNQHHDSLTTQHEEKENFVLIHDTDSLSDIIANADIAISGAGTTSLEIAYLGTPMITVILSENQKRVAETLCTAGAAESIGDKTNVKEKLQTILENLIHSPQNRKALSSNAMKLIDGQGSARVVMQMKQKPIRLRRATQEDGKVIWQWANDPEVRKNAFSQESIELNTHAQWFSEKLNSSNCNLYIAVDKDDSPVGQIRFEINRNSAEVDISIDRALRRKGLGVELLKQGLIKLFQNSIIETVTAYVKTENISSRKMFERAGFLCVGKKKVKGWDVFYFTYQRPESKWIEIL